MPKKTSEKLIKTIEVQEVDVSELPKRKTLPQIAAKLASKGKISRGGIKLAEDVTEMERIPTGILEIDYRLKGGFPRGKITTLAGAESSWKSSTCLKAIASVQKLGGVAAYIDAERTFAPSWAEALGVDNSKLLILEPETAEEAYNCMTQLILEGVDLVVLDSLNALAPRKEMFSDEAGTEAEGIEKEAMGVATKKTSQWLRTNVGRIAAAKTALLVICQLRDNLSAGMYGDPTTVIGGRAIKHYSSVTILTRMLLGKKNEIRDENDEVVGHHFEFNFKKNKIGKDGQLGQFTAYGATVDNFTAMLNLATKDGIITRPNTKTYEVNSVKYNGKAAMLEALVDTSTGVYDYCEGELRKIMGMKIYHYDPYQKQKDIAEALVVPIPPEDDDGVFISEEDE